ncbi:MAG TPA: hypothetical protein VMA55_18915, partial [Acidovorax sp.]|nr:hypothetical protein [Acidovorax sp.]
MSAEQERVEEDGGNAEPALWQSRWLNPTGADVHPTQLAWQEIKPWIAGQTLQERVAELRDFRWEGRPAYEVRALVVAAAPGAAAAEPTEQTVN